jgi:CCR4-NOT transcription complex subunit 6
VDARTRLERDCVGSVAQLALRAAASPGAAAARLVVANTHLYWDPAFADVKLAQAEHMLRRIALFRSEAAARCGAQPPVVFGGDFNSLPASEVHALLTRQDGAPPLRSAYAAATGAEPAYTNLTPDFTGTLDYLLVTPDVAVLAALETPGPGLGTGLPDAKHPSDHLPLAAVLGFGVTAAP